jgi:hypothetical protein
MELGARAAQLGYLKRAKEIPRILILVLAMQTGLIALRTLGLVITGFQTPDEYNYIVYAMAGFPYGNRYFFDYQLSFLFQLFSINSIPRFLIFFPFYLAAWSFSFLILAYKTVCLSTPNKSARNFAIFSLPFAISYSLLSLGLLSEGPGLTMCVLGIYAWLRYEKVERRWYYAAVSGAAFLAAAYSREPYVIFPLMGSVAWILLTAMRGVPLKHTAIFVVFLLGIVLVPTSPLYSTTGAVGVAAGPGPPVTTVTSVTTASTSYVTSTPVVNGTTTTVTSTLVTNTTITTTATAPQPGLLTRLALTVGETALLFFAGIIIGWGPLLFLTSLVSFVLVLRTRPWREIQWLVIFIMLLSMTTLFASAFEFHAAYYFFLTQGLSFLFRLSNMTIPAYLLLSPFVYERLGAYKIKILAVILVCLAVASAGFYVTAVQTNIRLPYNVLEFGHVYSTLEGRNILLKNASANSPTIVFIYPLWKGGELYIRDIPGIVIYPIFQNVIGNYSQLADTSYTNEVFARLHPSTFYVFSQQPLSLWNSNASLSSNVQVLMGYQPVYLLKTYAKLFTVNASGLSLPQTNYTIQSVRVLFASPTGELLKVNVTWTGG